MHVLVKAWKFFETENVSTQGGLKPPTFRFMPNALTIWCMDSLVQDYCISDALVHFKREIFEHNLRMKFLCALLGKLPWG